MEIRKYCPYCGHEFIQGETEYNYDTAHTIYTCSECDWVGDEYNILERDSE